MFSSVGNDLPKLTPVGRRQQTSPNPERTGSRTTDGQPHSPLKLRVTGGDDDEEDTE